MTQKPDKSHRQAPKQPSGQATQRQAARATALRANLKRRKEQARKRQKSADSPPGP